jgi:hypothetical protein
MRLATLGLAALAFALSASGYPRAHADDKLQVTVHRVLRQEAGGGAAGTMGFDGLVQVAQHVCPRRRRVCTAVKMRSTNRQPRSLLQPKLRRRHSTARRNKRSM